MTSAARIEANRRNALLSTGPTSPEGKAKASRNSLKHGMSGRGIVLPEAEEAAVAERLRDWRDSYSVSTPQEEFALRELARESVRIERCNAEDVILRARAVDRAREAWDDERRIAAEELGQTIRRRPSLVARKLQMTPQGCDWLIERWEALAFAVESGRAWDDAFRTLAADLLGLARESRDLPSPIDPADPSATPEAARSHRLGAIRAEIARLRGRREGFVGRLDADDRALAIQGVEVEPDRALARLRRYASACRRRFDAAAKALVQAASLARRIGSLKKKTPVELLKPREPRPADNRLAAAAAVAAPPLPMTIVPPALPAGIVERPMSRTQRRALERRRPELVG